MTGMAIITEVSVSERPSSSCSPGASGASIPQAEKQAAKARVASARLTPRFSAMETIHLDELGQLQPTAA